MFPMVGVLAAGQAATVALAVMGGGKAAAPIAAVAPPVAAAVAAGVALYFVVGALSGGGGNSNGNGGGGGSTRGSSSRGSNKTGTGSSTRNSRRDQDKVCESDRESESASDSCSDSKPDYSDSDSSSASDSESDSDNDGEPTSSKQTKTRMNIGSVIREVVEINWESDSDNDNEPTSSSKQTITRIKIGKKIREMIEISWARQQWQRYLQGGCTNHSLARRLINGVYSPLPPLPAGGGASSRQRLRHDAEARFFGIRDQADEARVRDLMARVVRQQFREPWGLPPDPVELRDLSARVVIAAARLFQETLIVLAGSFNHRLGGGPSADTYWGIPPGERRDCFGPTETYAVGDRHRTVVTCEHRTAPPPQRRQRTGRTLPRPMPDGYALERMGNSFVRSIGDYESIVRCLEEILESIESAGRAGRARAQERLGDLLIQYAHAHRFDETPELTPTQRATLLRICFLILEKEQSQWQSACFFWGNWKLGMAVSFARLILLFKAGHITLRGLFQTFAVYSNAGMRNCCEKVQKTCDDIDELYEQVFGCGCDAYADLVDVYGEISTSDEELSFSSDEFVFTSDEE